MNPEFSTQRMTESNPLNNLVLVDGFFVPLDSIQEDLQEMVKKEKKKKAVHSPEWESDENFAVIIGYTSGGFPYGITHEEMEYLNEKE